MDTGPIGEVGVIARRLAMLAESDTTTGPAQGRFTAGIPVQMLTLAGRLKRESVRTVDVSYYRYRAAELCKYKYYLYIRNSRP